MRYNIPRNILFLYKTRLDGWVFWIDRETHMEIRMAIPNRWVETFLNEHKIN